MSESNHRVLRYPDRIPDGYLRTILHRDYGKVVEVKGKIPTRPTTYNHDPVMGTGQLRYMPFCMNESPYTTRVMNCVYDEQVPADAEGNYIIISRAEDRRHGITTAPAGKPAELPPNRRKSAAHGGFALLSMLYVPPRRNEPTP
ncbi:hypothetical protein GFY24_10550 [Nocardia sp. SYP-A9097]|uniref:hypothetical protein n=1 Tax=Nocardia sp. SYP-A9097 TaxID=2663237 RepID=UPI00129B7E1E|nr:hypothetical protein [Nocardia sp. SYP-A9097]MRH87883.1 hypothetical protein [Nocardia sp. SYP-A9097]